MNCISLVLIRCSIDDLPVRCFINDHGGALAYAEGIRDVPEDIQAVLGLDASEPLNVSILRMNDGRPTDITFVREWGDWEGPGDGVKNASGESITQADYDLLDELGLGGIET